MTALRVTSAPVPEVVGMVIERQGRINQWFVEADDLQIITHLTRIGEQG